MSEGEPLDPELAPVDAPDEEPEVVAAALLQLASVLETGHSARPPRPVLASADEDDAALARSSEDRIFLSVASAEPPLSKPKMAALKITFFMAFSILRDHPAERKNRGTKQSSTGVRECGLPTHTPEEQWLLSGGRRCPTSRQRLRYHRFSAMFCGVGNDGLASAFGAVKTSPSPFFVWLRSDSY